MQFEAVPWHVLQGGVHWTHDIVGGSLMSGDGHVETHEFCSRLKKWLFMHVVHVLGSILQVLQVEKHGAHCP